MRMLRLLLTALLVLCASLCATGCATHARDYRDAPWDPKLGHSLMDPIPAWDDVSKLCGAHLRESERGARSVRC